MSELTIRHEQFPGVFPKDVTLGQTYVLVVTGIVRRLEDDLIDVTSMGGRPSYTHGRREIVLTITDAHENNPA